MEPGDPAKKTLRYIVIANEFRRRIAGGELVQGQQLPPQHQLAKSFGVTFNTLRQALDLLEKEGFVVQKPGSGTFVAVPSKTKGVILVVDDEEAISPVVRPQHPRRVGCGGGRKRCGGAGATGESDVFLRLSRLAYAGDDRC